MGKSGHNRPSLIRGFPVGSNRKANLLTKDCQHVALAHNVFSSSCFNILVLASVEAGNHFGSGILKVPQIVGGNFDGDDDFVGD